jgi:hypothetical protein
MNDSPAMTVAASCTTMNLVMAVELTDQLSIDCLYSHVVSYSYLIFSSHGMTGSLASLKALQSGLLCFLRESGYGKKKPKMAPVCVQCRTYGSNNVCVDGFDATSAYYYDEK